MQGRLIRADKFEHSNRVKQRVYAVFIFFLLASVQAFSTSLVTLERDIVELETAAKTRALSSIEQRALGEIDRELESQLHPDSPNKKSLLVRLILLRLRLLEEVGFSLNGRIHSALSSSKVPEPLKFEILSEIKKRLELLGVPFGSSPIESFWKDKIRQATQANPLFHCEAILRAR